ncbi:hypothetical protein N7451_005705 [Penicillium sp. IBT 35674x]|nr:hypothetical protein N7451_005705 [Penicillium sp. IBT 35674x]
MSNSGLDSAMITNESHSVTAGAGNERRNIFEDIVAEENVFQFVGSANGHTTTARTVTAKTNANQCLGDVSDTTIQHISRDRSSIPVKEEHLPLDIPGFYDVKESEEERTDNGHSIRRIRCRWWSEAAFFSDLYPLFFYALLPTKDG